MGVRVGVVAVAVVFAVAGCSAGDAPSAALPSGSAPPQSSPPTEPPLPATATQDTPAGAQSFARYWLAVLEYAYKSGDTTQLLGLGRCKSCRALADSIDQFYTQGGRFEGGAFSVLDVHATRYVKNSGSVVDLVYLRDSGLAIPASGPPKQVAQEKRVEFLFTLGRQHQSWQVTILKTVHQR